MNIRQEMALLWRKTPKNKQQFLNRCTGFPVFANSIPKSGTHLLLNTLVQFRHYLPLQSVNYFHTSEEVENNRIADVMRDISRIKKGTFSWGHIVPENKLINLMKEMGFRTFLQIRDPRDVVCSHVSRIDKRIESYRFRKYWQNNLVSEKDKVLASIVGIGAEHAEGSSEPLWDINTRYRFLLPWQNENFNVTIRFEDLVGSSGGGDNETQLNTLKKIAAHIGLDLNMEQLRSIAARVWDNKSKTFNKGVTGRWREVFDKDHKKAFKEIAGNLLIELGYENDLDW